MSRVFTFLLASFSRLARLFYFWKNLPLLCFSLVLFLVLFGLGFNFNLATFWGYLSLILRAFVCFIGSLQPSKTKSNMLFIYPLI
jgi:hypothetical protein